MKIILSLIFAALFILCGLAVTAAAQTNGNDRSINGRQRNQAIRIATGIKDGSLTPVEARRLQQKEAAIRRLEARFRASGGVLNPQERHILQFQLNLADRMIYRLRHNQKTPKA